MESKITQLFLLFSLEKLFTAYIRTSN